MGLLTLTCQMARRQEAAGVWGVAVRRGSWVARAYRSGEDMTVLLLSNQTVIHSLTSCAEENQNYSPQKNHSPDPRD